jgi:ribosome-binding factor A
MSRPHRSYKQAQKESLYYQEIAELFRQAALDHPELKDIFPQRVTVSGDLGMCTVFFFSPQGPDYFEKHLKDLILFKPSLRAAIARRISARRVPDFRFLYDKTVEKQERLASLFTKIKVEDTEE